MNESNGISVLLVDDEPDFLEITAKRLARRGFDVRTATTCGGGMEAVAASPPDIVVLDVMLPDMDGIQCLREIKRQRPEQAVILLTGHASMEAGLKSMEYGACDYCLKPVELEELVDKIEIACRDQR